MTTAKRILGCSKTASNTALRAELGIYSLKTNRDLRKLKWQHRVKNMQANRLPAIVDRFVWEKRTKGKAGIRWDRVVENIWKEIGGNKNDLMSIEDVGEYKKKIDEMIALREMKSLKQKVDEEDHLKIYGGLKEGLGMKTYLHGPLDYSKNLKLRFRIGDLDLPERRKRYTSSRVEEEEEAQTCPCGKARESRTHIVAECELYKKERDTLVEEIREVNEGGMDLFEALDSREKTIAILGDRCWPQMAKQDGDNICKRFLCNIWKKRNERLNVGSGVSISSRNGAPSR